MTERMFTTTEIAIATSYSEMGVRNLFTQMGIKPVIKATENGRRAMWGYSAYRAIMEWSEMQKEKRKKFELARLSRQLEEKKTTEELKALHPLVTDERFFKTEFFPDTEPACFKDLED